MRFVEALAPSPALRREADAALARGNGGHVPNIPAAGGMPSVEELGGAGGGVAEHELVDIVAIAEAAQPEMDRWLFMSDVCKHCTNAGCLDACPTGALVRTEFETVIVQPDVCNGCGYCIPSCPFGVIDRDPYDGRAAKCTLCYDRLEDGLEPACAKACPTDSIQFGPYDELVERAKGRVVALHEKGIDDRLPLRRGRRARAAARRQPRRVLPADRAARALRAPGAGRLADPGEHAGRHGGRAGRRGARRAGTVASMLIAHRRARR